MFNLIPEDLGGYVRPWVVEFSRSFVCLKSLHFRRMIVNDEDLKLLAVARVRTLRCCDWTSVRGFSTDGLLHITRSCRCSYDQKYPEKKPPPFTDGVLGVGNGKVSIVAQLHNLGLIRNVFGHCLSTQGNGYLFMGDNVIPSGTVWTPITSQSGNKHYSVGPAEFLYDGQSTRVTVLRLVFDSGSTYTYFSSPAYNALLSQLTKTMTQNKFIPVKDPDFSVCWKGSTPYSSVSDVKNLFKTLTLSFTQLKNVQFQLSPEAYLSVSKIGNVCSGILNSESQGLKDLNIIGDISMLDKLVIYDNEKQQVGWVAANCNNKPSMS